MKNNTVETIGTIIIRIGVMLFGWSALAMTLWNNFIAYEFNLPTFSYGAFILLRLCIVYFNSKFTMPKE